MTMPRASDVGYWATRWVRCGVSWVWWPDTGYSSSGECSTASSEYSALRFRDSPMSSSSR